MMDQELGRMAGRPVDRTKVKAAEVRFKPVKGWLGGDMTERVEGWSTKVGGGLGRGWQCCAALLLVTADCALRGVNQQLCRARALAAAASPAWLGELLRVLLQPRRMAAPAASGSTLPSAACGCMLYPARRLTACALTAGRRCMRPAGGW